MMPVSVRKRAAKRRFTGRDERARRQRRGAPRPPAAYHGKIEKVLDTAARPCKHAVMSLPHDAGPHLFHRLAARLDDHLGEGSKTVQARIDGALHERLRIATVKRHTSITAVIRNAVQNFVTESERAAQRASDRDLDPRAGGRHQKEEP